MHLIRWLRNWWGKSLRHRLLVSSIVTTLFFLVLLGYLSFRTGQTSMRREINQRNDQLATLVAKDIRVHFDTIWGNVRLFTYQLEASTDMLPLQARAMLELRRASPLTYRALYLFNGEGQLLVHLAEPLEDLLAIRDVAEIISRPSIPLTDQVSTAYEAAKNGHLFLSATHIVGADQVPVIYIGIPTVAEQARPSQIVVAEIDLRDIWRRIDEIQVGRTGRAFVVSQEGTIIAHPDRAYIRQSLAPELRPVLAGYEGQTEYTDPVSGARLLASYSPVGGQSGWSIVVEQERAKALAPVNAIAFITLGILLVAILIATTVTILMARSITQPIQNLAKATRTIARTGDLSQDVAVDGQDEVGQLATTFNQMIASLRRAEQQVRQLNEKLEQRAVERTAQLEVANKELEDFAYVASHDLKAPLRAISQLAAWLSTDYADVLDEDGQEYLRLLVGRAKRMHNLIEGLLQYSRVGQVPEKERSVDLDQLVQETIDLLAPPESIRITIEDKLPTVVGERTHLAQVFQNLLDNAVKFMDKPKGRISLCCVNEGSHWLFSVADNGPGIEKKYHTKIFQMFQTLTPRDEFESTGIGLPLVKKIVETSGGRVWVESTLGQGSTFYFTLPKKGEKDENH